MISYRQLDYWTRCGWLYPDNGGTPGSGHPRKWSRMELMVADRIGRLRLTGVEMETAVRVARSGAGVP